jgi:hypothetical protein
MCVLLFEVSRKKDTQTGRHQQGCPAGGPRSSGGTDLVIVNGHMRVGQLAAETARFVSDVPLMKAIIARNRRVQELVSEYAAAMAALAILEENPHDPAANLTAGKYTCFSIGEWSKGLPMLANGGDPVDRGRSACHFRGLAG